MTHEHHHHERTVTSLNKAFILGIALNVAFVVVEFAVGLYYGSMGLLSDAGHNLSDVAGLLLAMLAFRLAQARATPKYTYGYKKSTVLISLLNSVILLIAVGVIVACIKVCLERCVALAVRILKCVLIYYYIISGIFIEIAVRGDCHRLFR